MIVTLLTYIQPITVLAFLLSGILSLKLGMYNKGIINILFCIVNFFIFYGGKLFK